jgi:hypothetical protein
MKSLFECLIHLLLLVDSALENLRIVREIITILWYFEYSATIPSYNIRVIASWLTMSH